MLFRSEWVARQITEAFPWDEAPDYLIRDRDRIYGSVVTRRLRAMGIRDKPTAPASPWQNGFAERLIGSIRRECVDHVIVLGEAHLRRILRSYARYFNNFRTHRSPRPGEGLELAKRVFAHLSLTCEDSANCSLSFVALSSARSRPPSKQQKYS